MTSDELRAAAWRTCQRMADANDGVEFDRWPAADRDAYRVAVAHQMATPADDGEPVTADFAARHDGLSYTCTAGFEHHLRLVLDPRTGVWYYATVPVPLPTRGHVRRLLAALGVPPPSPSAACPPTCRPASSPG